MIATSRKCYSGRDLWCNRPDAPGPSAGEPTGGYSYKSTVAGTWDHPECQGRSRLPRLEPVGDHAEPTPCVRHRNAVLAPRGGGVASGSRWPDRWSAEKTP